MEKIISNSLFLAVVLSFCFSIQAQQNSISLIFPKAVIEKYENNSTPFISHYIPDPESSSCCLEYSCINDTLFCLSIYKTDTSYIKGVQFIGFQGTMNLPTFKRKEFRIKNIYHYDIRCEKFEYFTITSISKRYLFRRDTKKPTYFRLFKIEDNK